MSDLDISFNVSKTTDGVASVVFTCADPEITHSRNVNVSDCADAAAVELRLTEVARGVANKISAGVIVAPSGDVDAPETNEE